MIEIHELTKRFGPVTAVDSVSFEVKAGEVVGFLGANGAGKTTTLRVISCYLPPTSGVVRIAGTDIRENTLRIKSLIGYLPENNPLYHDMEVTEFLEWIAEVRGFSGDEKKRRVGNVLELCGLMEVLGTDIGHLSKGFRQRVGLAQAILHDPPILLLDEPTSGLDPNQTREVRNLILRLKARKTVMISTHILSEVQATADRVIIIHKGRIVAQGSPSDLSSGVQVKTFLTLKNQPHPHNIAEKIKSISGVAEVSFKERDAETSFEIMAGDPRTDLREEIFGLAVEKKWTLLELKREGASLEEVFRQLTLN